MTMIVALHLDTYVLIAAYRRETYQVNGEVAYVISDDRQKLIQWSEGIVTGSGYVPLLSEFKSKIADAKITFVDEIIEIAQECCNNLSGYQSEWKKRTNLIQPKYLNISPFFCFNSDKLWLQFTDKLWFHEQIAF